MPYWRRRQIVGEQGRRTITLVVVALVGFGVLYELLWEKHLFQAIAWFGKEIWRP